jgi:hypothetical protein
MKKKLYFVVLMTIVFGQLIQASAQEVPESVAKIPYTFDDMKQIIKDCHSVEQLENIKKIIAQNLSYYQNLKDTHGNSLLHIALLIKNFPIAFILIPYKFDLFAKNTRGTSSFDLMLKSNDEEASILWTVLLEESFKQGNDELYGLCLKHLGIENVLKRLLIYMQEMRNDGIFYDFVFRNALSEKYPEALIATADSRFACSLNVDKIFEVCVLFITAFKSLNNGNIDLSIQYLHVLNNCLVQYQIDMGNGKILDLKFMLTELLLFDLSELGFGYVSTASWPVFQLNKINLSKLQEFFEFLISRGVDLNQPCALGVVQDYVNNKIQEYLIPLSALVIQFLQKENISNDLAMELLKILFKNGANVNCEIITESQDSYSLLCFALRARVSVEIIEFLLKSGADACQSCILNDRDPSGIVQLHTNPIMLSITDELPLDYLKLLLKYSTPEMLNRPINFKLKRLLADGVDVYESYQFSILSTASTHDGVNNEIVNLLIKSGADVNQPVIRNGEKRTILMDLIIKYSPGKLETIKIFLKNRANPLLMSEGNNAYTALEDFKKQASQFIINKRNEAKTNPYCSRQDLNNYDKGANSVLVELDQVKKLLDQAVSLEKTAMARHKQNLFNENAKAQDSYKEIIKEEASDFAKIMQQHEKALKKYLEHQGTREKYLQWQEAKRQAKQASPTKVVAVKSPDHVELSNVAIAQALPALAVVIKPKTALELLKDENYEHLTGSDQRIVNDYLKNILKKLYSAVSADVIAKYGFCRQLFNKQNVSVNTLHILFPEVLIKNNEFQIVGGHCYQSLLNLVNHEIINKAEIKQDAQTGCYIFKFIPNVKDAKSIVKTSFPANWSIKDILKAVLESTLVSESVESEGFAVVMAKTNTKPEIPLKLIFKHATAGMPTELITAIPIPQFEAVDSPIAPARRQPSPPQDKPAILPKSK